MAEELERVEVSPGRFKKLTRKQAAAYRRVSKEAEPANKTLSVTGTSDEAAEPEPEAEPKKARRTTKRSSK